MSLTGGGEAGVGLARVGTIGREDEGGAVDLGLGCEADPEVVQAFEIEPPS